MLNLLWYITIILSIWGSSLGGIHVNGLGLLYPFRIISLLLVIMILIKSDKKSWRFKPQLLYFTIIPMILFLILHAGISSIWAIDRMQSLFSIFNLMYVLIFVAMFLNFCKGQKVLNGTLLVLSANILIIMLIAVVEIYSGVYLFSNAAAKVYAYNHNDFMLRFPAACFDNTNNLSFNICLTLPFMLFTLDYILKLKNWQRNLAKVGFIALSAFITIQTCSRLGYCAYIVILILYISHYIKNPKYLITTMIVLFSSATLIIGGLIMSSYIKTIGYDTKVAGENARSVRIRGSLLERAIGVAEESYFMGVGPGSIDIRMRENRNSEIPSKVTSIHEFYVEVLAVYGAIPLIFLLYFQISTFFVSLRSILKKDRNYQLAIICLPSSIAMIPASAMLSSPVFFFIMWVQFALWSILLSNVFLKNDHKKDQV